MIKHFHSVWSMLHYSWCTVRNVNEAAIFNLQGTQEDTKNLMKDNKTFKQPFLKACLQITKKVAKYKEN